MRVMGCSAQARDRQMHYLVPLGYQGAENSGRRPCGRISGSSADWGLYSNF